MTLKERVLFTRYLAILLNAGLTINQSLHVLSRQLEGAMWKKMLPVIEQSILSGHTLNQALGEFPTEFPSFYIQMIGVGETSGDLAKVFAHLEKHLQKDWRLISKVKRGLVYPAVIMAILAIVSIGLLIFVVPRVAALFSQLKLQLPLPTRILLQAQSIVAHYGVYLFAAFIGGIFLLRWTIRNVKYMSMLVDRITLRVPIIKTIIRNLNVARFAQILSTLLNGGVPLVQSLSIASSAITNLIYRNAITQVQTAVQGGKTLADSLDRKLFSPLMVDMMGIGERTGNLQKQTKEVARLYAQEVDIAVKNLSTFIEPLLLVVVAFGVGSIALAIVLPLYELPNLLHR